MRFWSWKMGSLDEISPPPQAFRGIAVGQKWRSKEASAGYHTSPDLANASGGSPTFMQDMVGLAEFQLEAALPPGHGRLDPVQEREHRRSGAMRSIEPGDLEIPGSPRAPE